MVQQSKPNFWITLKTEQCWFFIKEEENIPEKKNGHRQRHSKIQITKILAKGGKIIDEAKLVEKKKTGKIEKKVIKKVEKK